MKEVKQIKKDNVALDAQIREQRNGGHGRERSLSFGHEANDAVNDPEVAMGVGRFLKQLKVAEGMMKEDGAAGVAGRPRARTSSGGACGALANVDSPTKASGIEVVQRELEDTEVSLVEMLKKPVTCYEEGELDLPGVMKTRITPKFLFSVLRNGQPAVVVAREWLNRKGFLENHTADEVLLLAMVVAKMIQSKGSGVINSPTLELICRRWYAIIKAFSLVERESDWKQPRGEAGKGWRTKVNWRALERYDPQSVDVAEFEDQEADEEIREEMERRALWSKYEGKLPGVDGRN